MNDTPPQITRIVQEMFQKKTPEERFLMGLAMNKTSRELVIDGIRQRNPHITQSQLKQELFLSYYGNDFTAAEIAKILDHFNTVYTSRAE